MLKIGLTGGIGSGKTAVSQYFETLGVPVLDTDIIARQVCLPGSPVLKHIAARFGADMLTPGGELDREKLRALVFSDPEKRKQLEAIIHPAIREALQQQLAHIQSPYCVLVIPLLLEKNWRGEVDRILVVHAAKASRIARIQSRQHISEAQIEQIMASQISDNERNAAADDSINNDGSLQDLHRQIEQLHQSYLSIAAGNA